MRRRLKVHFDATLLQICLMPLRRMQQSNKSMRRGPFRCPIFDIANDDSFTVFDVGMHTASIRLLFTSLFATEQNPIAIYFTFRLAHDPNQFALLFASLFAKKSACYLLHFLLTPRQTNFNCYLLHFCAQNPIAIYIGFLQF